jgi:molybdenum cofactor synthesis domain-containing protein
MSTAAILIIGNEILSGRTQDVNLGWLARELAELGIALKEARVVRDEEEAIAEAINAVRTRHTYVFTTGGIGPTHDDITTACVAKAFGRKVVRHPAAEARLRAHYEPSQINPARLRMADVPEGAELVENPVSAAPGYFIENVYVLAGVPSIMQAMFASIRHRLKGGAKLLSRTVSAFITEGMIAQELSEIQKRHTEVEIGSYPFMRAGRLGVSIVLRGADDARLKAAAMEVRALMAKFTTEVLEEDLAAMA